MTDVAVALKKSKPELTSSDSTGTKGLRDDNGSKLSVNRERIAMALRAELSPDELTGPEQEIWAKEVTKKMAEPSEREIEFFKERRRLGIGVGLDKDGNIVHQKPEK